MKYYPSIGFDRAWHNFPMAKGYCLIAAAMTHDGWLQFSGVELDGGGYLGQQVSEYQNKR